MRSPLRIMIIYDNFEVDYYDYDDDDYYDYDYYGDDDDVLTFDSCFTRVFFHISV